eukprot:3729313-Alexandrium_andersonii.AAC.1
MLRKRRPPRLWEVAIACAPRLKPVVVRANSRRPMASAVLPGATCRFAAASPGPGPHGVRQPAHQCAARHATGDAFARKDWPSRGPGGGGACFLARRDCALAKRCLLYTSDAADDM